MSQELRGNMRGGDTATCGEETQQHQESFDMDRPSYGQCLLPAALYSAHQHASVGHGFGGLVGHYDTTTY